MGDCICVRRGDGPEGCGICNEMGTTPDIAGLCERLRKPLDYTLHLYQCDVDTTMANAADTLERQAAENKRLRWGLKIISRASHGGPFYNIETLQEIARAALTGEDT